MATQDSFTQDAHNLKEQITSLIATFEGKYHNQGVTLSRTPKDGLSMTIKPLQTQTYTARAGVTVPLAQSKGAATLAAPPPATK